MVPFDKLNPFDQSIVIWQHMHPRLHCFIMGILFAVTVFFIAWELYTSWKNKQLEAERKKAERRARWEQIKRDYPMPRC